MTASEQRQQQALHSERNPRDRCHTDQVKDRPAWVQLTDCTRQPPPPPLQPVVIICSIVPSSLLTMQLRAYQNIGKFTIKWVLIFSILR